MHRPGESCREGKFLSQTGTPSLSSWLDLKIPLWGIVTLLGVILLQSASLLIWGARIEDKVAQHSTDIGELQARSDASAKLAETVARIDERTGALAITINRLADNDGRAK